jgi:hypothetical protein
MSRADAVKGQRMGQGKQRVVRGHVSQDTKFDPGRGVASRRKSAMMDP